MPLLPAATFAAHPGVPPSPATLVGAPLGAAPFVDYGGILADLVRWLDSDERDGLRILTGPGGAGKTRTALSLCQHAQSRRWLPGSVATDAAAATLAGLAAIPAPLLVVMEHAETRSGQLAALRPVLAARTKSDYRSRVVLTVRDLSSHRWLGWRPWAGDELEAWLEQAPVHDLAQGPPDMAARRQIFRGASEAFAARLSMPPPSDEDTVDLGDPLFANPLMIHMGAYLTVRHEPIPQSAQELLDRFIDDHEDHYWSWLATRWDSPVLQDKSERARMAALATLAGADDGAEADRLLSLLGDRPVGDQQERRHVSEWAAELYPGPRYWNPVPSDLIAEHLVARACQDDQGILDAALSDDRRGSLGHPVRVLARSVVSHRRLADTVTTMLDQRLGYLCRQATTDSGLASALTDLLQVCPPDPAALPAILDNLPAQGDSAVRSLAAVLNHDAEQYYRSLVEQDPGRYRPHLAVALNNLSVRLAEVGRRQEASVAAGEAVSHYRALTQTDSTAAQASFAIALHNLSLRLAAIGRQAEAATAIGEAVAHYEVLDQADPGSYRPKLAAAHGDLAKRLGDIGRRDQAALAAGQAVGHFRALAEADPRSYRPKLAAALRDLSQRLADEGRNEKARAAMTEAVAQYRRLAEVDPAYRPVLAASLDDLALRLTEIGHAKEAAAMRAEARGLGDAPDHKGRIARRR